MKKNWWLILIIVVGLIFTFPYVFKTKNPTVEIGGRTLKVELAKTDSQRIKGLSNRNYLALDSGMIFIFPRSDIWPFWMKDTLIPLDIIWINASTSLSTGKIVDMTTLQPQNNTNIPEYSPKEKANYVLELNANSEFKVGDEVKISL